MPVRSLFVCTSGGSSIARHALYSANLISPISTALRRPHDAIYTEQSLPPCSRVISPEVVRDDLGSLDLSNCSCTDVARRKQPFLPPKVSPKLTTLRSIKIPFNTRSQNRTNLSDALPTKSLRRKIHVENFLVANPGIAGNSDRTR